MKPTPLGQSLRPACDEAVTRAIHRADPVRIHKRLKVGDPCPMCSEMSKAMKAMKDKAKEMLGGAVAP